MVQHNGPITFSTQRAKDIVHIFDPPKLLKTIRNLYMQHQFLFNYGDGTCIASWDDVELFYELSEHKGAIEKTSRYFFPTPDQLQFTTYAAKIFSKTVSTQLAELAINFGKCSITNLA